jgi:hypothetical protein
LRASWEKAFLLYWSCLRRLQLLFSKKTKNFLGFFFHSKNSQKQSFLTTLTIWPFKISRKLLFIKTFYLEWQEITDNHEKCFKAFFAQVMKETKFAWKAPRGKTGTCEVAKTCCKIIQNISRKYCLNYLITFTIFIFILTRSSL